jgi:hypothetical protein
MLYQDREQRNNSSYYVFKRWPLVLDNVTKFITLA